MAEAPETYVTKEMKAWIGKDFNRRVSPPISQSDIRKWAIAVYWPETPPRLYWDEEYAKETKFGGIVAPEDFNPFAWPVQRPAATEGPPGPTAPGLRPQGLNGGGTARYYARMRPGDVITAVSRVKEYNERPGRFGRMLFTVTETRWTNQRGELVKVYEGIGIRY